MTIESPFVVSKIPRPHLFFLLGFVYYFFIPPFALINFPYNEMVRIGYLYVHPDQYNAAYYLDGLILASSWLIGGISAEKLIKGSSSRFDGLADRAGIGFTIGLMMLLLGILLLMIGISQGANFFTGYGEVYDVEVLGPFSTLVFSVVIFRNFFTNKRVKFLYICVFLYGAVVLIGLGSRMLTLLATIAILIDYYTRHEIGFLKKILFFSIVILVGFLQLYVGVVRIDLEPNFENLFGIFAAEALYTNMTFPFYLELVGGSRPVFSVPTDLIAALLNFIPTIFFPGKAELVYKLSYNYGQSPLGAQYVLFNMYANFGYFYPLVVIGFSFYATTMYKMALHSVLYRAMYFSLLPSLIFFFQREGFSTLVKLFFFNGLVFPLMISSVMYLFELARKGRKGHRNGIST